MASNLPPGVSDSDIPGNRPEDAEWDHLWDWIGGIDISPYELQEVIMAFLTSAKREVPDPPIRPPRIEPEITEPWPDPDEKYEKQITVICRECGRVDEKTVETLDIEEGFQGADLLTFICPCGRKGRSRRYS